MGDSHHIEWESACAPDLLRDGRLGLGFDFGVIGFAGDHNRDLWVELADEMHGNRVLTRGANRVGEADLAAIDHRAMRCRSQA